MQQAQVSRLTISADQRHVSAAASTKVRYTVRDVLASRRVNETISRLNGGNEDDAGAISVEALNSDQSFSLAQPIVGFAGEGHGGSVVGDVVSVAASPHADEHRLVGTVAQPGVHRRFVVFVQRGQRRAQLRFSEIRSHASSTARSAALMARVGCGNASHCGTRPRHGSLPGLGASR